MGLFHPSHLYRVVVYDNQDRYSKSQFVAHNCRSIRIPLGVQTEVLGKYLSILETKGTYLPEIEVDPATGQERSKRVQWMPRFAITATADLTAQKEVDAPPVPAGGMLITPPVPEAGDLNDKSIIELRSLCAEKGIRYPKAHTKDELIELLTK